jgi:molybdenum cofactor cytidylyltransferase
MPLIPPDVPTALAHAMTGGALAAVPVFQGSRGHPVLFSARLLPQLAAVAGDEGARSILQGIGDRLAAVPSPEAGVLFDVDTPGALSGDTV